MQTFRPFLFIKKLFGKTVTEMPSDLILIAGLGNPGQEYQGTRHNIGFEAAYALADHYGFTPFKTKYGGLWAEGKIDGEKCAILMPQTYMNLSGQSVAKALRFYKIPVSKLIVLHDELDIPFGSVRIKQGGGTAGHNGLKSIDACLGDKNYWRVRFGIAHPGGRASVSGYVLGKFTADEQTKVVDLLTSFAKHGDLLIQNKMTELEQKLKGNG